MSESSSHGSSDGWSRAIVPLFFRACSARPLLRSWIPQAPTAVKCVFVFLLLVCRRPFHV